MTIYDEGQVQVYESVMQDTEGRVTHTLLRGASYVKDNRLLPRGFAVATAPADIAVYGRAVGDGDFTGGGDAAVYEIDVGRRAGPFTVSVELLYQALSSAFVQDLLQDDTALVQRFARLYDQVDRSPTVLASTVVDIAE